MTTHRERAPIADALDRYRERKGTSFHVPGHKNGRIYESHSQVAGMLLDAMRVDVTEISEMDDLFQPEGIIQEAQELAADCFCADESFFLVGGSTAGNLALILTVCATPGDMLLVQRNVHKSILNGLKLAGARVVFLRPEFDQHSGLAIAPSLNTIRSALDAYPEAKGLMVTMPNYYGMGSDLRPIAEACHERGLPLLVDEAHGAHYGHHPELPRSALACGADGVVQSTHKMLAAMTMGAMLHVQGDRLDRGLLRQRLSMIQSSSPSYPLMASLDLARRLLHTQGADAFTAGLAAVAAFRRGLAQLPRFGLLQPLQPGEPAAGPAAAAYTRQDPFKAVIYDRTGALSGYALQRALEARGCVPEMSDEQRVVLLFTLGSTLDDANHALWALMHIVEQGEEPEGIRSGGEKDGSEAGLINGPYLNQAGYTMFKPVELLSNEDVETSLDRSLSQTQATDEPHVSTWNNLQEENPYSSPITFSIQPISQDRVEPIAVTESTGRVAAEMVIPYPPGIPILYPGELVSYDMAERLVVLHQAGAKCQGVNDTTLATLLVFKQ